MIGKLFTDNIASVRLVERCGFKTVGVHLRHGQLDDAWRDVLVVERLLAPLPRDRRQTIQLATPDPSWPAQFEQERAALDEAISKWVCGGIHHMGSTTVPGLEAKPIIDILAGVHDLETAHACFGPLADLGYLYAPYLGLESRLDEVTTTMAVARIVVDEDLALDAAANQDTRLIGDGVVAEDIELCRTGLDCRGAHRAPPWAG